MTPLDDDDRSLAARILHLLRKAGSEGLELDDLLFWTAPGSLVSRRPPPDEHREIVIYLLGCLRIGGMAHTDGTDRYYCAPTATEAP